jgi:hypothetical protein
MNLTVWRAQQNSKKILKFSIFVVHPINTPMIWAHFTLIPSHFHSLIHTHTMYSSNSSEIEYQLTMVFQDVMEEVMSMLQAKEAVIATASSSTRGVKRRQRYVNRDHKAAHFRLLHDYFDDDYVYHRPTSVGGIVCGAPYGILSRRMYISLLISVRERCPCSSIGSIDSSQWSKHRWGKMLSVHRLVSYETLTSLTNILQREAHLTSELIFFNLQSDLIEHVWNKFH